MASSREYPYSPHERLLEFLQYCTESMKLTGISRGVKEGVPKNTFWGEEGETFPGRTYCTIESLHTQE